MSVLTTLQKLPDVCAATLPASGQPILIKAGVIGYYPAPPHLNVQRFNQERGITPEQVEAMLCGSMFGWQVPAADPDTWKNDPAFQTNIAKSKGDYPWDEFAASDEAGNELLHVLDPDARLRAAAPKLRDTLLYVARELAAFKPDYLRQFGLDVALEQVEKALAIADSTPAPASAAAKDEHD